MPALHKPSFHSALEELAAGVEPRAIPACRLQARVRQRGPAAPDPLALPAAWKPVYFASLTEHPLGEIEPLLHVAQLATQFLDLVPNRRDLGLAPLVQRARPQPCLLKPRPGDLLKPVEDDAREGDG